MFALWGSRKAIRLHEKAGHLQELLTLGMQDADPAMHFVARKRQANAGQLQEIAKLQEHAGQLQETAGTLHDVAGFLQDFLKDKCRNALPAMHVFG